MTVGATVLISWPFSVILPYAEALISYVVPPKISEYSKDIK